MAGTRDKGITGIGSGNTPMMARCQSFIIYYPAILSLTCLGRLHHHARDRWVIHRIRLIQLHVNLFLGIADHCRITSSTCRDQVVKLRWGEHVNSGRRPALWWTIFGTGIDE